MHCYAHAYIRSTLFIAEWTLRNVKIIHRRMPSVLVCVWGVRCVMHICVRACDVWLLGMGIAVQQQHVFDCTI